MIKMTYYNGKKYSYGACKINIKSMEDKNE